MSKELEMLESINAKLKINNKIGNRDIANREIIELSNYLDSVIISLRKTPTSEEVCEALSEYLGEPVWFDKGNIFRTTSRWLVNEIPKHGLDIQMVLPSHIIAMIGKFYEGRTKKNV